MINDVMYLDIILWSTRGGAPRGEGGGGGGEGGKGGGRAGTGGRGGGGGGWGGGGGGQCVRLRVEGMCTGIALRG